MTVFQEDILQQLRAIHFPPQGVFVLVKATALYRFGIPATRSATIVILKAGLDAGGVLVAERTFHAAVIGNPAVVAKTEYRAVLRFPRMPKSLLTTFRVVLDGCIVVTDPASPTTTIPGFCGTSTNTVSGSAYYVVEFGGGQRGLFQDISFSSTTPAGSSSGGYTRQVGDVSISDAGKGAYTRTGTGTSIWYVDAFGNYVDTHQPCADLPPPGDPPEPAKRIEGFNNIDCKVYPLRGNDASDPAGWTITTLDNDIVHAVNDLAIGGFQWRATVPRIEVGLNADFEMTFDDLPNGSYEFKIDKLVFAGLPKPKPNVFYSVGGLYPTAPLFTQYQIQTATVNPYNVWTTVPDDLRTRAGGPPAASIVWSL